MRNCQVSVIFLPSQKKSKKEIAESLKNKYHVLEDDLKMPYILKAMEEFEKYKVSEFFYLESEEYIHSYFIQFQQYHLLIAIGRIGNVQENSPYLRTGFYPQEIVLDQG